MMHAEFEKLAGYKVTVDTYNNIIEPMYISLPDSVTKSEFVKMLNRKQFEHKEESKIVRVAVGTCPNGTLAIYEAELLDLDIKTGKYKVKQLSKVRYWAEIDCDLWDYKCVKIK